jgi:hypothetical protein
MCTAEGHCQQGRSARRGTVCWIDRVHACTTVLTAVQRGLHKGLQPQTSCVVDWPASCVVGTRVLASNSSSLVDVAAAQTC